MGRKANCYRHAELGATKAKKKKKKIQLECQGLLTVLFIVFVLKKEKKKLTPFFFSSFSLQQIPPSFYFLHINGEREIDGILVLVWLRTKPQFCSV